MSEAAAGDLCAVDIPAGGGVGGRGTDWRGRRLSLPLFIVRKFIQNILLISHLFQKAWARLLLHVQAYSHMHVWAPLPLQTQSNSMGNTCSLNLGLITPLL